MSLSGIALYCLRAGCFAAVICGAYAACCRLRGREIQRMHLLAIAYLAALVQITVLRGGVDWQRVLAGGREAAQLIPFKTTLAELRTGTWPLIYHAVGNLIWFLPLGVLLGRGSPLRAVLLGALCSVGIELMQYLLMTGVPDVDDVILNTLGTALGWTLARAFPKRTE